MKYKINIFNKQVSVETLIVLLFSISVLILYFLPYIIFSSYSVITIHDNLDSTIPILKMLKDNSLFFAFDKPATMLDGMSSLFYSNYSFYSLVFNIMNDYAAFFITYFLSVIISFISLYIILKYILVIPFNISILVSLCFSLLPVVPGCSVAVSTVPLIFLLFYYFSFINYKFSYKIFLILLFPFFSSFTMIGIFILGFWLLFYIYLIFKNKKLYPNLLIGFILLCLGYILADLKLFYVMFILKMPLNRSIFQAIPQIDIFLNSFLNYFVNGHYHFTSFQKYIILPVSLLLCIYFFINFIKNNKNKLLYQKESKIKLFKFIAILIFIISLIAALYETKLLNIFIVKYIPVLVGFNWGRVWIFNRFLWYLLFGICLYLITNIKIGKTFLINKLLIYSFIIIQLGFIILKPVTYNDSIRTWFNYFLIKSENIKKLKPDLNYDNFITYKEFFSSDLFNIIKNDISYSDENAAAFGFHPSVLTYNGFNTIDGYNNAYPLQYMKKFRSLIAPELEINQEAREYYDSWGARMYLYSSELPYQPTRNKNTSPVNLNIDINVFKNVFNGKYILSRAEILNKNILGLILRNIYYDNNSIYTIYLYEIKQES
ncbi:MAG: DUF6044 family protein [Treponema sp.]|nr:DUF6044 family protein [Treponema sp.]